MGLDLKLTGNLYINSNPDLFTKFSISSRILQKSLEPCFWDVTASFSSISMFGSVNNHFATIISLSEFHFTCKDLLCRCKWKSWLLWARAAVNHGNEWGLPWNLRGNYISIPTWTHSQNSIPAAEVLSLMVFWYSWKSQKC